MILAQIACSSFVEGKESLYHEVEEGRGIDCKKPKKKNSGGKGKRSNNVVKRSFV